MKKRLLFLLPLFVFISAVFIKAEDVINITPRPSRIDVQAGVLTLPKNITVGGSNISTELKNEALLFVNDFNAAAYKHKAKYTDKGNAFISLNVDKSMSSDTYGTEGYHLVINNNGIKLSAPTELGIYYGLVSIKKLLPATITIGVKNKDISNYTLPLVDIVDAPRFRYRGFMLDCSRHFYSVGDLKHIIDLMAVYKMNKFHWHFTDDQGWRAEIKKYPKLTSVAATTKNSWIVDRLEGPYWTNRQYGPFYYTQEDMREIVAYAAKRHIDVIPEIEFPGHALACMEAYPEFSCNPEGKHGGVMPYGVSRDILNVGDYRSMQFVYDILTEIMDIFPSEIIHIGGDECPTKAWSENEQCLDKMKTMNLTHIRQLQSHFNKDVADFIAKRGRRLATWSESLDCEGADTELMASTGATIWCWTNAWKNATKAAQLGLDAVVTPWTRGYINRKQSDNPIEKVLPGDASDNVPNVYAMDPIPHDLSPELQKHVAGVQGTFWCENIGTRDMMEYMALPRLMCIAETGWTQRDRKDFNDFQTRMRRDTTMLNLGNYYYGPHYISETPIDYNKLSSERYYFGGGIKIQEGHKYCFHNNIPDFNRTSICYDGKNQYLQHSTNNPNANIWIATEVKNNANGSQTMKLKNAACGKYIGNNSVQYGRSMWPVNVEEQGQEVTITYRSQYKDYTLSINGRELVPIGYGAEKLEGVVTSGNTGIDANIETPALHVQGSAWIIEEVK